MIKLKFFRNQWWFVGRMETFWVDQHWVFLGPARLFTVYDAILAYSIVKGRDSDARS